jgi:ferric-dicitrate binding protein FerR (iron transport regulator)
MESLLASEPSARDLFQLLNLQAVSAAEHTIAFSTPSQSVPNRTLADQRLPSRRKWLAYVGGGMAAGIAATVYGWRQWFTQPAAAAPLIVNAAAGEVTVRTAEGAVVAAHGPIPPGAVIATVGQSSSVVLTKADGTSIALAGNSAISVAAQGERLTVIRGTATAVVPSQVAPASISLATNEASIAQPSGVVLTICRTLSTTEVGVQSGRVTVSDADGAPLEIVHGGEYVTVQADGRHRKRPVEPTPDKFALDLSRPLPEGWAVGDREETPEGPILLPVVWFDPYHQAPMYQIRSDHRWARGFVRLLPKSTFRIRFWVDRPGPSQVCLCVRTDNRSQSDTGMLECNGAFQNARPKEWQWLEIRASDMLENKHTPKFGAPWVPFLLIFNTYKEDLGLKIAEFLVE